MEGMTAAKFNSQQPDIAVRLGGGVKHSRALLAEGG